MGRLKLASELLAEIGTPSTVLKVGGEWGGDFNSTNAHTWTQALTTVSATNTLR